MNLKKLTGQLILLLMVCKPRFSTQTSCIQFQDTNDEIMLRNNSTASVTFVFSRSCQIADNKLSDITVRRRPKNVNTNWETPCTIHHSNGVCAPPSHGVCTCNKSVYTVFQNITVPGEEEWIIETTLENGTTFQERKHFHFIEPANITSLRVKENDKESHSLTVDVNSSLTITCSWEKGRSRELATLYLNEYPVETRPPVSKTTLQIDYTTQAKCEHNGMIRCRVPSALEKSSKHIVVRCKPNFGVVESKYTFPANSRQLLFPIKTYGLNITNCTLQKLPPQGIIDKSQARINRPKCQTLPTGILAVELENVTSKKVGAWNLKVWNRFGFDTINFTIDAREDPVLFKEATAVIIAAALAVFGVTVLTIALAIMCRFQKATKKRRRGRRSTRSRKTDSVQGSQNGVVPGAFYRSSNVSMMITNDIYASTPRHFSMPNSVQQRHSKDPVVSTGTCSPPPCGPILWSMKPSSDLFCTDSEFPIPGERCPEQKSEPGPCKLTSPNASHLNNHFSQGRAAEEEGDYAEIDDGWKEGDVVHVSSNVYVDVAEIQRRKREQRKQKEVCNGI